MGGLVGTGIPVVVALITAASLAMGLRDVWLLRDADPGTMWVLFLCFVVSVAWMIGDREVRIRRLRKQLAPTLELVFKPEQGEPYAMEIQTGPNTFQRFYRVGIANKSVTTAQNVAVLLRHLEPREAEAKMNGLFKNMEDEKTRFPVAGNSEKPKVFVTLFHQSINRTRGTASEPYICQPEDYSLRLKGQHPFTSWR